MKAFWLALLTIIACFSFVIIFQWPKLQFNISRITFDALPFHSTNNENSLSKIKTLDIDITYYIGSHWEVPNESLIPLTDIPTLDYISDNKMTSTPGTISTFEYALEQNLTQLIEFCSKLKSFQQKRSVENKRLSYRHYHRHIIDDDSIHQ